LAAELTRKPTLPTTSTWPELYELEAADKTLPPLPKGTHMKRLSIDIETYSSVELKQTGVYRYSESPDFTILLFGYSVDGDIVRTIDLANGETIPQELIHALFDSSVEKWAFNAQFERVCLSRYIGIWLQPESWRCSMVWASTLG